MNYSTNPHDISSAMRKYGGLNLAKISGLSVYTIYSWIRQDTKPMDYNLKAFWDSVEVAKGSGIKSRLTWVCRYDELLEMSKTMRNTDIAKKLGVNRKRVDYALRAARLADEKK